MKKVIECRVSDFVDEPNDSEQSRNGISDSPTERNERVDIDIDVIENKSPKEKNECDSSEKITREEGDRKSELENSSSETAVHGRRSTRLQGKRPRLTMIITSSDEENWESSDEEMFEFKKKETKRGHKLSLTKPSKPADQDQTRIKNASQSGASTEKSSPKKRKLSKKSSYPINKPPKEFSPGSFVVAKCDFHATMTPPIWKIDGKALLQKFVHFDKDGQTLYKNTSTYSGWTLNNKDQYYPATVENKVQNRKETVVKFRKELVVADDSD